MTSSIQPHKSWMIIVPLCSVAFSLLTMTAQSQTYIVQGVVSTTPPSVPVRSAAVTFVDNSDTTRAFSSLTDSLGRYRISVVTGVEPHEGYPSGFKLEQNYPNPFLASTGISYQLNKQSDVQVTIYDILGREIRKFTPGVQAAGKYGVQWDGRSSLGKRVAAGIYFYRLQTKDGSQVKKMVFGMGDASIPVPLPQAPSPQTSTIGTTAATHLQAGVYRVRIENTGSTFPTIIPRLINNVVVQGDTTLNFAVSSTNFFPAVVYMDSTRQVIRGFGAANILPWRPDMTTAQVNKAFGTGTGQIGFTILRLRLPNTQSEFSIQVPTAQLAQSLGVTIIASPWSPPAALKTNNNIVGGELRTDSYANYAAHLKSFVDYMASTGVSLYAVSIQNEPDAVVTYESCSWNATQILNFMKNNAAAIGTRVFAPESENFNRSLSDPALNDSIACSNTSFIGGHIYGGGLTSYPLALSKGKELWMTEHLDTDTTWSHVLATGKEINDCMNANMSAYIWWYIVRFYGPVDESGNVSKRGYIMSQYSRFVRPGYFRVSATYNPQANVYVTAFKQNVKVVVVALNMSSAPINQTFIVQGGNAQTVIPYVTSLTKNCVQGSAMNIVGGNFTASLDAQSVTTFVSN